MAPLVPIVETGYWPEAEHRRSTDIVKHSTKVVMESDLTMEEREVLLGIVMEVGFWPGDYDVFRVCAMYGETGIRLFMAAKARTI